jgi:Arc/MetJ family transcription regulator
MTDSRQELQTLAAATALMVGLHQAIEAYHEAVRGALSTW